ncbi:NAD(P)H-dependent oxidoreductase [Jannaschia formosa]|uniref:NAD(P)H-dependent oxidoreductase n=1 Tax=Jannaschia formosa TaxID=2259592 RepID=UPI000E1BD7D7|nr:NAD(P)H-dependent oxidoreductase [Jannaschia formosa]TFL19367.1 flavodoxin family protein [Jannaschia formosa]
MPRAHVLFAHPVPESLGAAAHAAALDGLRAGGWEVDDCDLYAERFDPVLTCEERRGYHDTATNTAPVQGYVDRLRAADALVLCFPVWNFGYPAILKGWFDRVMLPGVSFHLKDGRLSPALRFGSVAAVTTYGATRRMAWLAGDPPRKLVHRLVGGPPWSKRTRYLAQYDMNNIDRAGCEAFLARVRREMERFR